MDKLDALEKLAMEATCGPWVLSGSGRIPTISYYADMRNGVTDDERYISAASPDVILSLISEVKLLRAALEEIGEGTADANGRNHVLARTARQALGERNEQR